MTEDADGEPPQEKPKKLTAKQRRVLTDHWKYPSHTFGTAVLELAHCGFIDVESLEGLDDGVFACTVSNVGFNACARELAYLLPGQIRPLRNGKGLVWINGQNGPHGVLLEWETVQTVKQARATLAGIVRLPSLPWTIGAVARQLLRTLEDGKGQPYQKSAEYLLDGVPYGYHECTPGVYKSASEYWQPPPPKKHLFDEGVKALVNPDHVPAITMYDVEGYYFAMLKRLKGLHITVYPDDLTIEPFRPDMKDAWTYLLESVEENKTLRNSLAGALAGSLKRGRAYCRDLDTGGVKVIAPPGSAGPYRAAGLLLVRSGVELCHCEALTTNSVYATIDSVVTTGTTTPVVWPSWGFTVSKKGQGNGEICHRGSYQIGNKRTLNYANGDLEYIPCARIEQIPIQYHRLWL